LTCARYTTSSSYSITNYRQCSISIHVHSENDDYDEMGVKGGETVKAERGRAFYEQIGKKGGDTVKAERGAAFYETIGKKGGEAVKAERGTPFYEEIGKKGGHRVRTLIEEGKKAASEAASAKEE